MNTSNKATTAHIDSNIGGTESPMLHCYLIHLEHLEPHEDNEDFYDEGVITSELLFVSAASKEQALADQIEIFRAKGYWQADQGEWRSTFTQLTDSWDELVIQVFDVNDHQFWSYACWHNDYFSVSLTSWAQENLDLTECLYNFALAGNTPGHHFISEHQGLRSAYEKHQLSCMSQPTSNEQIQYRSRAL